MLCEACERGDHEQCGMQTMAKEITLTRGKVAIVDADLFESLGRFNWRAEKRGPRWYAARTEQRDGYRTTVYMHAQIMGTPKGMETDHENGNGLDNRRSNLRIATRVQNSQNQGMRPGNCTGMKGVTFDKSRGKWLAQIRVGGRNRSLGRFDDRDAAAAAYDAASREHHGSFGRTNAGGK